MLQQAHAASLAALVPATIALVAVLAIVITDLSKLKIRKRLPLPLLASALVYHGVTGGEAGLLGCLLAMLVGFSLLMVLHFMEAIGPGDVGLMTAIGAWLGMPVLFYVFAISCLVAGVYTLTRVLLSGRVRESWVYLQIVWHRLKALGRYLGADERTETEASRANQHHVPFSVMVALGIIATLLLSWIATTP